MKNYFIKFIISLFTYAGCISCDDLIETDYPTNQIGANQVFEDANTAFSALSYLYSEIRNNSFFSGTEVGSGILLGIYTDDLYCFYNDQNGLKDIHLNQTNSSNSFVNSVWKNAFKQIYLANSILEGMERSTNIEEQHKKQIKGEALFLRSYIYFYLHQYFGSVPYTTSTDYEYNSSLSKMESSQLLQTITSDLTNAISYMGDEYRNPERIYVNKKTGDLLLAKVYLSIGEYAKSEQILNSILNSSIYSFQYDINEVFHKESNHILWQLPPITANFPTWESIYFYFKDAPPHSYALTNDLISTFDDQDIRKFNWIEPVYAGNQTWFRANKYKNIGVNQNEYSVIFRLEEAYLLMAEALWNQNRIHEALPYLNATRQRAGLQPFTETSFEVFQIELRNEKRREFFTELGHRFIDLKRWGKLDLLYITKQNWSEKNKLWPIPVNEILLNPNLNPQNEGY
jgi:hypothetical protein